MYFLIIIKGFCFFSREFANKLSLALLSNSNIPLQKLDLSHNPLEDKGRRPEVDYVFRLFWCSFWYSVY